MHWFITLHVRVNQWSSCSFLLEISSAMAWQVSTASGCLPCPPASYSCTITLYIRAAFATLLWFRSLQYQKEAVLLSRHQPRTRPWIAFTAFFWSLSFPSTKKRKRKDIVWGFLWVSSVSSCAHSVCIFHLRIAEKNWECKTKQMSRLLKYLHALSLLMRQDGCAWSFFEDLTLM